MKSFFDRVFGFPERGGYQQIVDKLKSFEQVDQTTGIVSYANLPNGNTIIAGRFETPNVATLRSRVTSSSSASPSTCSSTSTISVENIVGNVAALHKDTHNEGSVFQAASQFNCLEMVSPSVRLEEGIGIYESDNTQGPKCAIACAGGTAYRNYGAGQTSAKQLNTLDDLEVLLDNVSNHYFKVNNGYIEAPDMASLVKLNARLSSLDEATLDKFRDAIKIGVQHHTQVTTALPDSKHCVTQTYNSACRSDFLFVC